MLFKLNPKFLYLILIIIFAGCSDSQDVATPEKIGDKQRSAAISGNRAAQVINKMHDQSVAAVANVIAEYGQVRKDLLYISSYANPEDAGKALDLMIKKMAVVKKGPFAHLMPLAGYKKPVYFALGLGAAHYIYRSGNYLLWFQTYQSFADKLPPRLLMLYPL